MTQPPSPTPATTSPRTVDDRWFLTGKGPRPWPEVQQSLQGMTCAWADYQGFHVGSAQSLDQAPPYSHIWGWSPGQLVRIRIDGDEGIVGILTRTSAATVPPANAEAVTVRTRPALAFRQNEPTFDLVEVVGPMPLIFVAGPSHG